MNFSREMLDEITRTGKSLHFSGWMYDLVLERLELSGFKLREKMDIPQGDVEGSVYWHPDRGIVKVLTSRIRGPFTVVEHSPEKPFGQG